MPVKKNLKNKPARKKCDGAYVVTVDMGYGHQRAAYPLKDIAVCPPEMDLSETRIITANNYPGIPAADRRRWEGGRKIYEKISRMFRLPFLGRIIFGIMDYVQRIDPFYPRRDLSHSTFQVRQQYGMIHRGWGKDLIERLNKRPLPLITSFFTVAFFAEEHEYQGEIYCLCTDTDISRAWVPMFPQESRIKYFAPNKRVRERLILYGINKENIFVTGFPLPKENIGKDLKTLKSDLNCRLVNLDPAGKYKQKYKRILNYYFGDSGGDSEKNKRPLTITFAVGGAGAQRSIGVTILDSLHDYIDMGHVRLNLVAGTRNDVYRYYEKEVRRLHLDTKHKEYIHILYAETKDEYFKKFNEMLRTTDVLWTKPSELSFYVGLGIPIIIAPTIGSQEDFNKAWLHQIGSGFEQENPKYTNEWLFDWLHSGWLAQAAMEGFLDAPRNGVYHIEEIVLKGKRSEIEDMHFI
ncbi:MAG: hypothetical protein A2469_00525 [Candidatus Magasanikbacteria bacterium RIFOXYC2_FULL_40_16]|uniref:DUF6938 domain-containing protein n=2 Tax=Candidatus Magasanikiibacteriota TaxID=1752731 RepID=A0A1F6NHR2_9BACT|nr:MAG: hypothetical protein A2224_00480 [Candidatus Magasanikbacteria bacterium RIFOXYA2_FULL_40_20]OGH83392.1 MAG: hypothetical protein A2373_00210 [Candidatus Magasanikbacteria bacterium RIFOXYB1_FULL_40_15]OGH86485.1 MAG: hypothetical protein A2301_00905 [Candidatus Magasanikbacteria bacterium RIFOXYB2_FULL_40_13]OGH90098.1 MAG: hypothetical protein A2469_00525 [Candidatus Magasanikbacteria bacterium RIFOXYC2_FULL_40_16]